MNPLPSPITFLLRCVALSALLCVSACASSGPRAGTGAGFVTEPPQSGTATSVPGAAPRTASSDYKIGPQDLLEVSVFQVTELNRTVRVNGNGEITLPLVGSVHAGGKTVQDVEGEIARKLTESYLQNPQVSVFVKEFTSQRVTLEGSVTKPGIYPLTGSTTLLQAIALGQGLTEMADPQGVLVFRMIDGKRKAARFDLREIRKGAAEDPMIQGDDIVVVEESGSKSMFSRIIKAMPALGVFSFF